MNPSSKASKALILLVPLILFVAIVQLGSVDKQTEESEATRRSVAASASPAAATKPAAAINEAPKSATSAEAESLQDKEDDSSATNDPKSKEVSEFDAWDRDWLTADAMNQPKMAALPTADPSYDGTLEARQLFHDFEVDLRAADPLNPTNYRDLISRHKARNAATLRRVMELREEGRDQAATDLFQEWSRLFELYRKLAYSEVLSQ